MANNGHSTFQPYKKHGRNIPNNTNCILAAQNQPPSSNCHRPTSRTFLDLPAIQQVTAPVDHAEGPVWDHRKNVLYFVDIHAGAVLCYKYFTKELNSIHFAGTVGMVAPSRDNPDVLMVANNRSVLGVKWDGYGDIQGTQLLTTVANNFPTSRFNDGKPDSKGRLWFGKSLIPDPCLY